MLVKVGCFFKENNMAKKKYKEKIKTVYVKPTDEQVQRAVIETTPMKEEMEEWMGCKTFTLSCLTLHATVEDLISYTHQLQMECVPAWFEGNKDLRLFMDAYLTDVEALLKMIQELKLIKQHKYEESI